MALNSVLYRIAISLILLFALTALTTPALAAVKGVGTVINLSGPLFGKKADGSSRTLAVNSSVEQGDTLVTEKRTYGRVKFIDGGEIILRPGSNFVVESYLFDKNKPGDDKAELGLVKGSLRAITGQVSKRGNQDAYKIKTPVATIGIRGTIFDLKICNDDCPGFANGLYFFVAEGIIEVSNSGGAKIFSAGSYGYVQDENSLPVMLPLQPHIDFTLPPFSISACGVR